MHSIFSRARTVSTPYRTTSNTADEFGRVPTTKKKDKDKDKDAAKRSKTLPPSDVHDEQQVHQFPDGAFLPLNLERPKQPPPDPVANPNGPPPLPDKEHDYGYLSYERHVVLGLDQIERLVEVVSEELETRGGITTPFIFSTTALDISSSAIKRLIRSFLRTCENLAQNKAQEADHRWREEARFAGPHELGMCLRWGLARVIRSVAGQDVRGLVSWEHYVAFRDSEAALGYPATHFATQFLPSLTPSLQAIIIRLLSLLTRLVANSTSSGHTPPTLSPLFGPLFFGLGPATLAFHHAYVHYLRAVNAMEHIILSFIRWQDVPRVAVSPETGTASHPSASAATLGVPVRLKEWIKGYPAMLPFLEHKKPQPRRGSRTIRVMSVRRNVRMYSPDLVKTASTWAHRPAGSGQNNGLANSKEWERIAPPTLKLAPRYSEAYKKRMDMPSHFHPDVAPGTAASSLSSSTSSSYLSTASTTSTARSSLLPEPDYFGLGVREGEDRFRSLTDLKWGEFESMGFNDLNDDQKLQFDLTESARTERTAKRQTLSWNDFSSAGFTRMDAPLSATLQFSTPFVNTISSWPSQNVEMTRKLKKTQKSLPAFGWDTEPVVGSEEVIEEAFVDVFCDLVYGGGWMDLERGEMLDRDCNWALVEYKSLPPTRTTTSGGSDPRTSTTLILFEEFVPLEYREQLAVKSASRRRLPSLFSTSSKSKQWKQAPTLNGRPYVVGAVPHSPTIREVEFERLLHGNGVGSTKVLSLNSKGSSNRLGQPTTLLPPVPSSAPPQPQPPTGLGSKKSGAALVRSTTPPPSAAAADRTGKMSDLDTQPRGHHPPSSEGGGGGTPTTKRSRFRLPATPSAIAHRKSMVPAEYSTVEFETRMASYSDDELNGDGALGGGTGGAGGESEDVKQRRRESSTDAWVDILVGTQARRMGGQDAEMGDSSRQRRGATAARYADPDSASLEVAQVLAAVQRRRSASPESLMEPVDMGNMDAHVSDTDVVEVETVPRTSGARSAEYSSEDGHTSEAHLAYDDSEHHGSVDPHQHLQQHQQHQQHQQPASVSARLQAKAQRRLGYFDLHPERRQANTQSIVDDPRARLARDDSDVEEDDEDDEHDRVYGTLESVRPLPVPPAPSSASAHTSAPTSAPTSASASASAGKIHEPSPRLPTTASTIAQQGPTTPASSKTAALIEMYRERERGGGSGSPGGGKTVPAINTVPVVIAPLQPSKLPVRSGSLPLKDQPPTKTTSTTSTTPEPVVALDPPRIPLEETGRNSPGRYVHGAPLHNVLEEEEE